MQSSLGSNTAYKKINNIQSSFKAWNVNHGCLPRQSLPAWEIRSVIIVFFLYVMVISISLDSNFKIENTIALLKNLYISFLWKFVIKHNVSNDSDQWYFKVFFLGGTLIHLIKYTNVSYDIYYCLNSHVSFMIDIDIYR